MQKLMSFVLSATMFAYMACAETPQKNTDPVPNENITADTGDSPEDDENLILPEKE